MRLIIPVCKIMALFYWANRAGDRDHLKAARWHANEARELITVIGQAKKPKGRHLEPTLQFSLAPQFSLSTNSARRHACH